MSTHPTILGEMIRTEGEKNDKTSLDVERDLAISTDTGSPLTDPARDMAIPPSDLPDAERQPDPRPAPRSGTPPDTLSDDTRSP